jgi:hypothetical protein
MGTTYYLGADLVLAETSHDRWLAMPLEGVTAPAGGWIDDGPVELDDAAAVLSALADAADHFSYVVDAERITVRAFFSQDWLIDHGSALARALAAVALAEGRGSVVVGDAGTRRGATTQLVPGKPPKTSAMRAGALDVAALAEASGLAPTGFARPAKKTAKKTAAKTAAKTVKKTAAKTAKKTAKKTARR